MTVINAIRFDSFSGAMSCDEQTTVGDQRKVFGSDKIKSVIPPAFTRKTGVVAAYGGTGTSAIGEEIRFRTFNRLRKLVENNDLYHRKFPDTNQPTLWQIGELMYDEIVDMKQMRIDELLTGRFGFTTTDFIKGSFQDAGKTVDLNQDEVVRRAFDYIANHNSPSTVESIFLNRGILAGYDPQCGFQIIGFSLAEHSIEPISALYHSVGSGSDTAAVFLSSFARMKTIREKRERIDPVEGLAHLIAATNAASLYNMGVGGYFNIVIINGRETDPEKRLIEISDHRSKLASEIISASFAGLLSDDKAFEFIERMLFKGESFENVNEELWVHCSNPRKLNHLLRGYKI